MVNYGVSRGCETCRKRRKKCDEKRPMCNLCLKSGNVCLGYRTDDELYYRHSSLTKVPVPSQPSSIGDIFITENALGFFIDKYVVHSHDSRISRGFLGGLPSLLARTHPSSDVVKAVEIVAWATLGNQLTCFEILERAKRQYVGLLSSFQIFLQSCNHTSSTAQALVIAFLLGLYEIVSNADPAPDQEQQQHITHVRGVSALLLSPDSPFDFLSSTHMFEVADPLIIKEPLEQNDIPGVLSSAKSNHSAHNLDFILVECHPLFARAQVQVKDPSTSPGELQYLFEQCLEKEAAFLRWYQNRDSAWKAKFLAYITQGDTEASQCPFVWPGPVHEYFDVYVAAVMNTYRKTYLMLLAVLKHLAPRVPTPVQPEIMSSWEQQTTILIDDILASIPFHLTEKIQDYRHTIVSPANQLTIGRPVGGLLLLHPLYVLSTLSIVPPHIKSYAGRCLSYIGKYMGIGQGTLMSKKCANLPFQDMAEGHVIIWAGMIIHPVNWHGEL